MQPLPEPLASPAKYIPPSPGPVLTSLGVLFEAHHGLHSYTVGQKFRKSGLKEGERWFVAAKDRKANALVVVEGACVPLSLLPSCSTARALTDSALLECQVQPPAPLAVVHHDRLGLGRPLAARGADDRRRPLRRRQDHVGRPSTPCRPARAVRPSLPPSPLPPPPTSPAVADRPTPAPPSRPDGSVQVTYVSPPGEILTPGQTCAAYVGPRCLGSGTIAERAWEWPEGAAVPSDADAAGAEADGGGKGGG